MTTDPRDGFTPGPWSVEFNTYRENNGSLTVTDSYINSPDGLRMFLDCDPEQASRIVDGMNERTSLLADNERQAKVIEAMRHERAMDLLRRKNEELASLSKQSSDSFIRYEFEKNRSDTLRTMNDEYADRIVSLESQVATLTRELDEAREAAGRFKASIEAGEGHWERQCHDLVKAFGGVESERDDLSRKLAVAEGELTIARQEWDDQYAKFIKVATERDEYAAGLKLAQQKLAESTSERETLETQLAAAKERVKRAERERDTYGYDYGLATARIAHLEGLLVEAKQAHSCANNSPIEPDKRSGDAPSDGDIEAAQAALADPTLPQRYETLRQKLGLAPRWVQLVIGEFTQVWNMCDRLGVSPEGIADMLNRHAPSSGPADEGWMEKAAAEYFRRVDYSGRYIRLSAFIAALRAHAPAARYPEVVEFLDAVGDGPWSMSAGFCEGKASYYVQSVNVDNGTWFTRDTLAAACRAALDSRKERADG